MAIEKKSKVLRIFFSLTILIFNTLFLKANEPDSAYLFAYGDENGGGLHFAWSIDQENWHAIGNNHPFLRSDYGRWGSQKRMYDPFLLRAPDGQWHSVWSLNNELPSLISSKPGILEAAILSGINAAWELPETPDFL